MRSRPVTRATQCGRPWRCSRARWWRRARRSSSPVAPRYRSCSAPMICPCRSSHRRTCLRAGRLNWPRAASRCLAHERLASKEEVADLLLSRFPRVSLAHLPTPLEFLPRLTRHLGGPNIFVKRDDCTGLGTGGNKTRKLEFLMADALQRKATVVITQGAVQSNHARQTAAAAAKLGLKCELVFEKRVEAASDVYLESGNVLLDRLFGARIREVAKGSD